MKCDPFDQAFAGPAIDAYCGLTKREYFAAQVLAGAAAGSYWIEDTAEGIAEGALAIADALIKELNK